MDEALVSTVAEMIRATAADASGATDDELLMRKLRAHGFRVRKRGLTRVLHLLAEANVVTLDSDGLILWGRPRGGDHTFEDGIQCAIAAASALRLDADAIARLVTAISGTTSLGA